MAITFKINYILGCERTHHTKALGVESDSNDLVETTGLFYLECLLRGGFTAWGG